MKKVVTKVGGLFAVALLGCSRSVIVLPPDD